MFDGQVTDGGVESDTTTLKAGQDAWLLALSVAVHTTVIVPSPSDIPDVVLHNADAIPELSTALKFHVTTAVGVLPFVGKTINGDDVLYGGHVNVGGVVSALVMANEHVDTWLA